MSHHCGREIAELIGQQHRASGATLLLLHRDDADGDFVSALAAAIDLKHTLLFLTAGQGSDGAFFLFGPEALVDALSPQVAAALQAKGGGKKGRFQGKTQRLADRDKAVQLITAALGAAS